MNLVNYINNMYSNNNMKVTFSDSHENILTQNSYKDSNQYSVILISSSSFGCFLNGQDTTHFQFHS